MRRVVIAGLLGGLIVYLWGSISWMALPFHEMTTHTMPNGPAVLETLRGQSLEHGVYTYPPMSDAGDATGGVAMSEEQVMAAWRAGPLVPFMVIHPEGINPWAPLSFVRGALIAIVTGVIIAWLLATALPVLPTLGKRVGFVATIAVIASLIGPVIEWQWLLFPAGYTVVAVADILIGWTLAGIAMAWYFGRATKDAGVAVGDAGYRALAGETAAR